MQKIIVTLLAVLAILSSCSNKDTSITVNKQRTLTVVQASDIFTLDPHTLAETVTHSVLYNMMEPLIALNRECKIDHDASLAEGWMNPDDRTWKFFIRPGIRFHNGKILTVDDVKASLMRARMHPLTDVGGGLGNIESITTEGDLTLVIKTKEPMAILPYKLYFCLIIPKELAEKWDKDEINEKPIGTGPYRLVSWEKGHAVKLEAFDDYWMGKPAFDRVAIIPETNPEKRVEMMSDGKGDLVVDIPVDMVETVKTWSHVRLISQEGLRIIYLGFDVGRDESPFVDQIPNPLKNRKVREAIYRAIDEDRIVEEVLNGYGIPASQFCAPIVFGFNPKIERLSFNQARARELLSEAGYPDGFSLTLHCPNNRYIKDEEIGATIVDQLRKVGIDARLEAQAKEIFLPAMINGDYSFYLAGWDCPDGDASTVFFDCLHTKDGGAHGYFNGGGYSNSHLDSLIELIETAIDPIERTQLFENAQEIGMNDIPWIPLHTQMNLYGVRKNISFKPRHDKSIYLRDITPEGVL
jgi:peptide/nickel transport system substrate-binding protein